MVNTPCCPMLVWRSLIIDFSQLHPTPPSISTLDPMNSLDNLLLTVDADDIESKYI